MPTPMTPEMTQALQEILRDLYRDKGHHVHEWPADEAAAYRDNGGFAPGAQAVEDLRIAKATTAIEKLLTTPTLPSP